MIGNRCVTALVVAAALYPILARGADASGDSISFDRDIRPILSENCFACHGPDEAKRKARLRLDQREDALKPAKSGERPIVPGDVSKSELISRITAEDEDDRMPPTSTGKTLKPGQIDLMRRWIEQGAKWQTHWSFAAPVRPETPPVSEPSRARNEIDRFVLARLDKEGLKPSPEADKPTLIRRASLDLTGLPPTVEEVDRFLSDDSPDAYDKLVDRLMSWQRFGEHQAGYWMDAVRYADTHGYHIDSQRDMWKYRDWVIQAFNDNKPFDEFATDQLAGDLEPNATLDQKIATGYVRANMSTGEGGAIEEEYRAKYTFDRVETTAEVFMGMTLMCARCHSHKYDPIQHSEYYGLYAFFNQLADKVMDEEQTESRAVPEGPSAEQATRMAWLKEHIDKGQAKIDVPMASLDASQAAWQREWQARLSAGWFALEPERASSTATNGPQLRLLPDRSILAEGAEASPDAYELTFSPAPGEISALRLETFPSERLPRNGSGRTPVGAFALSELEAELVRPTTEGHERSVERLKFARSVADAEAKDGGIERAVDGKPETAWQTPTNSLSVPHTAVFVLHKPVRIELGAELRIRLRHESKAQAALGHYRFSAAGGEGVARWLHPPEFGAWQVLGPLKTKDGSPPLDTAFEPESKIDLKKKFPGVREEASWSERSEFEDAKPNLLVQDLHGVHGVRYLYRTLNLPNARTLELSLRVDGLFRLWVNGEMVAERRHPPAAGEGATKVALQLKAGENRFLWKVVTVQGASYFTFSPDMGSAESLTGEIAAILATSPDLTPGNRTKVRDYFRREHSVEFRKTFDDVAEWRRELDATDRAVPTTMIAKEADTPRDTFILLRGEYDKKGDKVQPHVPAIFPPLPNGAPANRLGLAKWLLDPSHPLTARVTVNRMWQHYFGVGLVKTAEDFGVQGERPSNQELLDWLATEFIRSGWDMKHMHRLIATSATYRQSSRATESLVARDPENRLLARGPRFRLEAEGVRDMALCVSGLLVEKVGGEACDRTSRRVYGKPCRTITHRSTCKTRATPSTGAAFIHTGNGKALHRVCCSSTRPRESPARCVDRGRTLHCKPWRCSMIHSSLRRPAPSPNASCWKAVIALRAK